MTEISGQFQDNYVISEISGFSGLLGPPKSSLKVNSNSKEMCIIRKEESEEENGTIVNA